MKGILLFSALLILSLTQAQASYRWSVCKSGLPELDASKEIKVSGSLVNRKNKDEIFATCEDEDCEIVRFVLKTQVNCQKDNIETLYLLNEARRFRSENMDSVALERAKAINKDRNFYSPFKLSNDLIPGTGLYYVTGVVEVFMVPAGFGGIIHEEINKIVLKNKLKKAFIKNKEKKISKKNFNTAVYNLMNW